MLVLGVYSVEVAAAPGEAVHGAREAGATAEVGVQAALAWRDFMVSNYTDTGQQRWLADRDIDLLRGAGRLAGTGVVEVDGVRHTAEHVVVATGSDPIAPPIPGLRELHGVWGTREATSMAPVSRRLLVLGGRRRGRRARAGRAAARRRSGDRRERPAPARPRGDAARRRGWEALERDGIELMLGMRARAARREGEEYVLQLDDGSDVRGDRLLLATGRRPRVEGIGLDTVGVQADAHGIQVDEYMRAGERLGRSAMSTASGR